MFFYIYTIILACGVMSSHACQKQQYIVKGKPAIQIEVTLDNIPNEPITAFIYVTPNDTNSLQNFLFLFEITDRHTYFSHLALEQSYTITFDNCKKGTNIIVDTAGYDVEDVKLKEPNIVEVPMLKFLRFELDSGTVFHIEGPCTALVEAESLPNEINLKTMASNHEGKLVIDECTTDYIYATWYMALKSDKNATCTIKTAISEIKSIYGSGTRNGNLTEHEYTHAVWDVPVAFVVSPIRATVTSSTPTSLYISGSEMLDYTKCPTNDSYGLTSLSNGQYINDIILYPDFTHYKISLLSDENGTYVLETSSDTDFILPNNITVANYLRKQLKHQFIIDVDRYFEIKLYVNSARLHITRSYNKTISTIDSYNESILLNPGETWSPKCRPNEDLSGFWYIGLYLIREDSREKGEVKYDNLVGVHVNYIGIPNPCDTYQTLVYADVQKDEKIKIVTTTVVLISFCVVGGIGTFLYKFRFRQRRTKYQKHVVLKDFDNLWTLDKSQNKTFEDYLSFIFLSLTFHCSKI